MRSLWMQLFSVSAANVQSAQHPRQQTWLVQELMRHCILWTFPGHHLCDLIVPSSYYFVAVVNMLTRYTPLFMSGFQMSGARPCSIIDRTSAVRVPGSPATARLRIHAPAATPPSVARHKFAQPRTWLGDVLDAVRGALHAISIHGASGALMYQLLCLLECGCHCAARCC